MTMQASGLIKFSDIMAEIDSDEEPFRLGHANNGIYETINVTNSNANKPDTVKHVFLCDRNASIVKQKCR